MEHIKGRYGVEAKNAQELQENAAKMANNMAAFCERMGYRDLEVLISRFQVSPYTLPLPTEQHNSSPDIKVHHALQAG